MTAPTDDTEPTVGQLVTTIKDDVTGLIRSEIDLAKTELQTQVKSGAIAAVMLVAAGVIALFAVGLLSMAAAYGIHALGLGLGWSFLIVGGFYLLITLVLLAIARAGFGKLGAPERTQRSAKQITAAFKPTDQQ